MKQFWQDLQDNKLKPVYLFFGEEPYLLEEALSALQKRFSSDGEAWNIDILPGETVSPLDVVLSADTYSFFGGERLVLVKNIPWFSATAKNTEASDSNDPEEQERDGTDGIQDKSALLAPLLSYLDSPAAGSTIVLIANKKPDKRQKAVRQIQKVGRITEFPVLKNAELSDWIKQRFAAQGRRVHYEVINLLLMNCGNSLHLLANEIDKLLNFCPKKDVLQAADCLPVISKSGNLSIFSLIDAISARRADLADALYREMSDRKEPAQKILVLLARQFHDMLAAQNMEKQGFSRNQIMETLDIRFSFIVDKLLQYSRLFTSTQLMKALDILLGADIAAKTGHYGLESGLQTAILQICSIKIMFST